MFYLHIAALRQSFMEFPTHRTAPCADQYKPGGGIRRLRGGGLRFQPICIHQNRVNQ